MAPNPWPRAGGMDSLPVDSQWTLDGMVCGYWLSGGGRFCRPCSGNCVLCHARVAVCCAAAIQCPSEMDVAMFPAPVLGRSVADDGRDFCSVWLEGSLDLYSGGMDQLADSFDDF